MIFLLFTLTIWVVMYNLIVIKDYGIPESLSETSYFFTKNGRSEMWFTMFCLTCGIFLMMLWLPMSNESFQPFVFLSCGGMIFAGTTPLFKESFQKPIHYASAIISLIFFILWMVFSGYYILLAFSLLMWLFTILADKRNYVYYAENIMLFILLAILFKHYGF